MDLVIADRDNVGAVYFLMSEDDVKLAMQQPWVSVGTDYGAVSPTGPLGESKSHPRAYGSFARILGKYVREEHTLRMEDAIRKFTSLPAQREKLDHRGLLRTDYFADITIFDPEKVRDTATFDDPNRPSVGFEYVFVNGVLALEHDKVTGTDGRPSAARSGIHVPRLYSRRPAAARKAAGSGDRRGWMACSAAKVTLTDATGAVVGTANSKRDGRYQIILEKPCKGCSLQAEHMGFAHAATPASTTTARIRCGSASRWTEQ